MNSIELLKFYTPDCGACKMLDRVLKDLSLPDGVILREINAEQSPELAGEYRVFGVPSLLLVKDGEILKRHQGFLTAMSLQTWFEEL